MVARQEGRAEGVEAGMIVQVAEAGYGAEKGEGDGFGPGGLADRGADFEGDVEGKRAKDGDGHGEHCRVEGGRDEEDRLEGRRKAHPRFEDGAQSDDAQAACKACGVGLVLGGVKVWP